MDDLRVLIADDELGMRRGAAKVLKKFRFTMPDFGSDVGFLPVEAADGSEAMDHLLNSEFDLVLLDYKMPGYSGLEVLEQIREQKIDVMAVMVTAYASLEVAVSATKNGAFDFLAKPFTPDELKSVVRKAAISLLAQREAQRLAAEKRKVRFQFISVLAHELKAPLAAVDSYLQLMKRHVAGEELEKYDHIVERSLIRIDGMRKMIFDLLDLTRIESGQKVRELTQCSVDGAARMSIETMAEGAKQRGIDIEFNCDSPVNMMGDNSELEIIFNNLISNAVKYNRDNGKVFVTLKKSGDQVKISVRDTGYGMSQEEQERLFGEFVRIKNENTRNVIGSGLGLSILKKLTALYKGKISVQSEKDVGSTFSVVLHDLPAEEKQSDSNEESTEQQ